jgi:molecular chaperone GrpE (heat shock protein)
MESKLEAGFSDLRGMIETMGLASAASLSFDECFDAMDGLEEAARLAPDEAHAQGIRAVSGRLERFLTRAGFQRLADTGEAPDARQFRVVGTEACDAVATGQVLRVVRAAISRQGKLVREGEVIVSMRST